MNYSNLVDKMLVAIPEIKPAFDEENSWWDEILPHIVFGDVVNPSVIQWLYSSEEKTEILNRTFSFFERMATCEDEKVVEVLAVTVLERLGDEKHVLEVAKSFMGNKTKELSDDIEKGLGRL